MEVEILPADLKFKFQVNKQLLSTLSIFNHSDQRLAYKIKTTAPKKYVVRPSSGVVDPRGSTNIQVIMQAQKEYPTDAANCKDKFMVQTMSLKDDEQPEKELFSSGRNVKDHRLKVILDAPAAPPSPVPEEKEGEEESAQLIDRDASSDFKDRSLAESVPADHASLKAQLERVIKERDDLVKRQQALLQQSLSRPHASAIAGTASSEFKVTVIHMVIVAVLAFLIGHFT